MFLNKTSRTGNKLEALENRIQELRERVEDRGNSIKEKQEEAGRILAELAINESSENQENLKSCKKAIERMRESLEEAEMMLNAAILERDRLKIEMAEAEVRESPDKLEELAKSFNLLLDEGLSLLDGIDTLHRKLEGLQSDYHTILNRRGNALSRLNKVEGLVISEGLGRLSQVGGPHNKIFTVPSTADKFIAALKQYRESLVNYEKFKMANPDFEKDIQKTREMDNARNKIPRSYLQHNWTV